MVLDANRPMSSPFSPFKSQAVQLGVDYVRTPTKLLCIMYVHATFRAWPFCSFVPCIPPGCIAYTTITVQSRFGKRSSIESRVRRHVAGARDSVGRPGQLSACLWRRRCFWLLVQGEVRLIAKTSLALLERSATRGLSSD